MRGSPTCPSSTPGRRPDRLRRVPRRGGRQPPPARPRQGVLAHDHGPVTTRPRRGWPTCRRTGRGRDGGARTPTSRTRPPRPPGSARPCTAGWSWSPRPGTTPSPSNPRSRPTPCWASSGRCAPMPRAGLNEERVVDEAERMADEVGPVPTDPGGAGRASRASASPRCTSTSTAWPDCSGASRPGQGRTGRRPRPGPPSAGPGGTPSRPSPAPTAVGRSSTRAGTRRPSAAPCPGTRRTRAAPARPWSRSAPTSWPPTTCMATTPSTPSGPCAPRCTGSWPSRPAEASGSPSTSTAASIAWSEGWSWPSPAGPRSWPRAV